MTLDLSRVISKTDTILNGLLSKYKSVRFISFNEDDDNAPYYSSSVITKGFYYKEKRLPVTHQVIETLRIVPESGVTDDTIKEATMLELKDAVGNFVRFSFETYKEPHPPNNAWVLLIKPNAQEQTLIN